MRNTGLVEVPMGMTLREIVEDIGGGVPNGKRIKAVQTGGPSGGFIPESQLDLPVDFDALYEAGSMMGSGGLIVMDEDTCIVDTTRYYVNFLAKESCGQCVPCREGLRQMSKILDDIVAGRGKPGDIELLEELCELLEGASLCALGQTAPNPVRSALAHFRDEFEAHVLGHRCPALVCKQLHHYVIDQQACPAACCVFPLAHPRYHRRTETSGHHPPGQLHQVRQTASMCARPRFVRCASSRDRPRPPTRSPSSPPEDWRYPMNIVRLTIDGKTAEVEEGTSLLDAARSVGVDIPTLCHHPKLEPFGACRMCLVEVEKSGRKRTVAPARTPRRMDSR